jgi:y4mF family transcriptional regulator
MSAAVVTPSTIAKAVKGARREQGLDQQELATAANVAVRSVHRIENAHPTVQFDIVLRVLSALGIQLEIHP